METGEKPKPKKVNIHTLPFTKGFYISNDYFVVGGYDKVPITFKKIDGQWKNSKVLDEGFNSYKDFTIAEGDSS